MKAHHRKHAQAPEAGTPLPAPLHLGPARWLAGEGAWEAALPLLQALPAPLGLAGEAGLLKAFRKPLTQAWLEGGLELELLPLPDGVDCCPAALAELRAAAKAKGCRSLIGFGGGRALDLAKLAAAAEGWGLAAVPSSPATCACATSVAVLNDGRGGFAELVDLGAPPALCIVDLNILRAASPRLLAAGLADTLAKWLEWRAVESAPSGFGAGAGWSLARRGAEAVEACGAEALRGSAADLDLCLEACLLHSAAASGAGAAPAAAAHSLANALSRQAAGKGLLHGEAVGLGLLWQESLLQRAGREHREPAQLARLLKSWGLPAELPAGLDRQRLLADAWAEGESVRLLGLDPGPGGLAPWEP